MPVWLTTFGCGMCGLDIDSRLVHVKVRIRVPRHHSAKLLGRSRVLELCRADA